MALKRLASGSIAILLVICSLAGAPEASAAGKAENTKKSAAEMPRYLPKEIAAEYGKMYIYYNDRVCPMQTFAQDFTMKLYGRRSWNGLTAEQVLTGWIFYGDSWNRTLDLQTGSSPKAQKKLNDRQELIMLVRTAGILKIFPYTKEGKVTWYASVDRLPREMSEGEWIFVRKVMSLAGEHIAKQEFEQAGEIFSKVRDYQFKTVDGMLPSDAKISAERIYNRIDRPKAVAMLCLSIGILLFIFFSSGIDKIGAKRACKTEAERTIKIGAKRHMKIGVAIILIFLFLYLSLVLGLRWGVSGHAPFAGGFEVMMLLAWLAALAGLVGSGRFLPVLPFAFLLCGFALLVAAIGESDPSIAHLVPVLASPLLSLHVMAMMISYCLLGLVMLNSLFALVNPVALAQARDISLIILYFAVFFLAVGTFLGAVWANVSWGRYWAWDPKEVWALITLLVYAFALHSRSLRFFARPSVFHWYCALAFLCVIITYFGVNFLLGGLHSYA